MRYLTLAFFLVMITSCTSNRKYVAWEDKYPSAERTEYWNERTRSASIPKLPAVEDVLNFKTDYCTISEIDNYSPYIDSLIWRTPYIDSLLVADQAGLLKGDLFDEELEKIAGISRWNIIKHEKQGDLETFIYLSSKYSNPFFADQDIWIAISKDKGKTWNHYFTGLYDCQPVELKWYSEPPLIAENNILQIEGVFVRQTEYHSHPSTTNEYEIVKDGLLVTFDLNRISMDSDGDGLTDITEIKFRTYSDNPDTNGNGIVDGADPNPRQNVPSTESTVVFEYLVDSEFKPVGTKNRWKWTNIPSGNPGKKSNYVADSTKTILIVTDDPSIKAVNPEYVRAIVLTKDESDRTSDSIFKTELNRLYLTPLFKVDGQENLYLVDYGYMTGSLTYLVEKRRNGWRIKVLTLTQS